MNKDSIFFSLKLKQVREFLGAAGYCRLWIPGFAELAVPLCATLKGSPDSFTWGETQTKAFQALRDALMTPPTLALPDPTKPFRLFVAEKGGVTEGVLTQYLGPWRRPVAYLSERLDPVASGGPPCIRQTAPTALLVEDAN